ncbi:MAG: hypothetical protein R3231_07315, partial [bacterium]|nr:hypothetical protein [bacterium]
GSAHATEHRDRLLAEAFPARTLAAGREKIVLLGDNNIDMQAVYRTKGWPGDREAWLHNDIRVVAYPYLFKAFDEISELGGSR